MVGRGEGLKIFGAKKQKKQKELEASREGVKNLPVIKHDQMSLN